MTARMRAPGPAMSLLDMLNKGLPIDTAVGSWGNGGGQVTWWPLVDFALLATGETSYSLFNEAYNKADKTPYQTNMPGDGVPAGERWDLYGMHVFLLPSAAGTTVTQAIYDAFRALILGSEYEIAINTATVRRVPMWFHAGHQGFQNSAVTPTLALQTPMPSNDWHEKWPEECYLPLQEKVNMTFDLNLAAPTASALNGYALGIAFDRAVAAKTP